MFDHIKKLYMGKAIGSAQVISAFNSGWIVESQVEEILSLKVNYTLDEAIKFKKDECSYLCSLAIANGVDVKLSDGSIEHFSLSDDDQRNLNAKMMNIVAGITELEYHSDGHACKYYSAVDMADICTAAQQKITIETTYNNCLYQWIKGCKTVEEVSAIKYGLDIPEEYWSEPWKRIKQSIGTDNTQEETPEVENSETESK